MEIKQIKKCLITGATSGIGEALARELAERGVPLLLTGRNEDALELLGAETGAVVFAADLSNPASLGELLRFIDSHDPDLQIHNAGFGLQGPFDTLTDQEVVDMIQVNCTSLALLTKRAIERWKRRGEKGVIVNVASILSHIPFAYSSLYASTKAFVRHLSLSILGEDLKGIKVLTSCPGAVVTDFHRRAGRGHGKRHSSLGMPVEKAVTSIIYQIEKEKREVIFDTKYALYAWMSKYLFSFKLNSFIARRSYPEKH